MRPIICGMFISKTNFQITAMESEIRSELGSDIFDSLSLSLLKEAEQTESGRKPPKGCLPLPSDETSDTGYLLQFKTYWDAHSGVFEVSRFPTTGDFKTDMICVLSHEKKIRAHRRRRNISLLRGKRVLDWVCAERLIRCVLRVAIGFSAEIAFLDGSAFNFAVTGDHNYLPKAYLKNAEQRANDEKSCFYCTITASENR